MGTEQKGYYCPSPSKVRQETLLELQAILREDYGREITLDEAGVLASGLVGYFDLLAKIHHRSKNEIYDVPLSEVDRSSGSPEFR